MGCMCVGIDVLDTKPILDVRIVGQNGIEVNPSILNAADFKIERKDAGYKVLTFCLNSLYKVTAQVKNKGVSVCASLVCSVGPLDYYYLLVDEGYLLTVNGEYFTVEKDESV